MNSTGLEAAQAYKKWLYGIVFKSNISKCKVADILN